MLSIKSSLLLLATVTGVALPATAQRLKRITEATVVTMPLTKTLGTKGTLGGVCVDADGTIFVANFNARLWRIEPNGETTLLKKTFTKTSGNTIAPDGRLIQCDFALNRVYEVDKHTGALTTLVNAGLNGPVGVAASPSGELFIANCNSQTIRRGVPGSSFASLFASSPLFNCPNGIAFGPDGNLYVVNFFDNNILRVDSAGVVTLFATCGTTGNGGGHIARVGNDLYATMFSSHDIYKISMSGQVERLIGVEGQAGLRDGKAPYAHLRYPNGIAADPSGGFLYTNNLDGPRDFSVISEMRLRRILLP